MIVRLALGVGLLAWLSPSPDLLQEIGARPVARLGRRSVRRAERDAAPVRRVDLGSGVRDQPYDREDVVLDLRGFQTRLGSFARTLRECVCVPIGARPVADAGSTGPVTTHEGGRDTHAPVDPIFR